MMLIQLEIDVIKRVTWLPGLSYLPSKIRSLRHTYNLTMKVFKCLTSGNAHSTSNYNHGQFQYSTKTEARNMNYCADDLS